MKKSMAVAAAAVVCAGVGVGTPVLSASATGGHHGYAPAVAAARGAIVQGLVLDQGGKPVDDVKVVAYDESGAVVASDLTYASDREDGPQHGYYYLETGRGEFKLVFSRAGYSTTKVRDVTRARGERGAIDPVELVKDLVPTKTVLSGPAKIKKSKAYEVSVNVKPGRPTGKVTLFEQVRNRKGKLVDERLAGTRLVGKDAGEAVFDLGRLSVGKHTTKLKAVYDGDLYNEASTRTDTLTVTVTK